MKKLIILESLAQIVTRQIYQVWKYQQSKAPVDLHSCLSDSFVAVALRAITQVEQSGGGGDGDGKNAKEALLLTMRVCPLGQVEKDKLFKCVASIRIKEKYAHRKAEFVSNCTNYIEASHIILHNLKS